MSTHEKLKQLRKYIVIQLENTEQHDKPNVFAMYYNPKEKDFLIKDIEKRIIEGNMKISTAISAIEREFNINLQND